MKRVAIYTKNKKLGRKFELILRAIATVDVIAPPTAGAHYSSVFIDCESFPEMEKHGIALPYTVSGGVIRNTPFLYEDVIAIVNASDTAVSDRTLSLSDTERAAILGDDKIPLTEVEYKLLETLLSTVGFIDRASLVRAVWGDGADGGVLTVYVHYLREKLERHGEKVIITSRAHGYAIDEKYREVTV